MGNTACCDQQPKKQFDHTITIVHKQNVVKVPQLAQPIRKHMMQERPFEQQLPDKPVVKQFGNDVYEGKVDERGRPQGFGKMYHKNGSLFIGEFESGVANGDGHFVKTDSSYYHGRMYKNQANDENGYFWSPYLQYRGGFRDNQFHGSAQENGKNHIFKGNYNYGKKHKGVMRWSEGNQEYQYEGLFNQDGKFQGKGKLTHFGQGVYQGEFENGKKHGFGSYTFEKKSLKYVGDYYHDMKEGQGKIINSDGTIAYEGQFKKGLPHGIGKTYKDGQEVQTFWNEGLDSKLL